MAAAGYFLWLKRRHRHRVRPQHDDVIFVRTDDGWDLPVHLYRPARPNGEVVYLQHGMGANALSFDFGDGVGLAPWLREHGYQVYVGHVRGKGDAHRSGDHAPLLKHGRFSDYVHDVRANLQWIANHHEQKVHFIGHSLGGVLGYCIAGHEGRGEGPRHLKSMMAIASALDYSGAPNGFQALEKLLPLARPLPLVPLHWSTWAQLPLRKLPRSPLSFSLNIKNIDDEVLVRWMIHGLGYEPTPILQELAKMVRGGGLRTQSGDAYFDYLPHIDIPIAAIAGSIDGQCAVRSVKDTFDACGDMAHTFLIFGRDQGHAREYGHLDLVAGQAVNAEVYPDIMRWLSQH